MNERIQELKHQAFLWCDENIPEQYSHETGYGDAWEDKFAELLIRECLEQIDDGNSDHAGGNREAIDRIKEHFGVEE